MRRLLAVVAAGSVALAAASAQAAHSRLTISIAGSQVLYGHPIKVAGRVPNGHAGMQVTVYARPYGALAASPVATVTTHRGGSYRYFAHPTIQTSYTAHFGGLTSRTMTVGVRPLITIHEMGNGQIQAHVLAARSFRGRFLKLQQQQADASWKTVVQRPLVTASSVIFAPTLATSHVRAVLSVNEAGKGYLGSFSGNIVYHSYQLTLTATAPAAIYGRSVKLAGHLISGKVGEAIDLYARPYGQPKAVQIGTATTTKGGWWKLRVTPRIWTRYHATWTGTEQSPVVAVGVRPVITIHELSNGAIRVHVHAGKSFRGRFVKLQQQGSDGSWATVGKAPLDATSTTIFAKGPSSRLRAVMSVNQAGKGYLGGYSHVLAYHAR